MKKCFYFKQAFLGAASKNSKIKNKTGYFFFFFKSFLQFFFNIFGSLTFLLDNTVSGIFETFMNNKRVYDTESY